MTHVDDAIRRALSAEDAHALDALSREENIIQQALNAFRGRNRLFGAIGWTGGLALFAVGCLFVWRFFAAVDIREMLIWGGGAGLVMAGLAMIKLWFFMEMQKNEIVREVKRLELQVSALISISSRGA